MIQLLVSCAVAALEYNDATGIGVSLGTILGCGIDLNEEIRSFNRAAI